jgi:hypothetical protein
MDGVVVRNSSGRRLEELLWEWISVVERTVRRWPDDDDAAWMYNERASISIFGGAVWRMGGVVFEEFVTDKPNRPAQVLKPGVRISSSSTADAITSWRPSNALP